MKKPPEGLIFSRRDIFRIILPLVAEQFLAMFVGMADSVMISSVGEAAVSAVSLVDSVSILLIQLFTALATGGAVVAGQYLGAKNEERARRVSDQLILLIFLISAVVTAALFFLRGVILRTVFGSITQEWCCWHACSGWRGCFGPPLRRMRCPPCSPCFWWGES